MTREDKLTRLANAAFKQATLNVIQRAKQTGTPVIIWEDEALKAIAPEELEKRLKSQSKKRRAKTQK